MRSSGRVTTGFLNPAARTRTRVATFAKSQKSASNADASRQIRKAHLPRLAQHKLGGKMETGEVARHKFRARNLQKKPRLSGVSTFCEAPSTMLASTTLGASNRDLELLSA